MNDMLPSCRSKTILHNGVVMTFLQLFPGKMTHHDICHEDFKASLEGFKSPNVNDFW